MSKERRAAAVIVAVLVFLGAGPALGQVPLTADITMPWGYIEGITLPDVPVTINLYGADGLLKGTKGATSDPTGQFYASFGQNLPVPELIPGDTLEIIVQGESFAMLIPDIRFSGFRPRTGEIRGRVLPAIGDLSLAVFGTRIGISGFEDFSAYLPAVPLSFDGSFVTSVEGSRRNDMLILTLASGAFRVTQLSSLPGVHTIIGRSRAMILGAPGHSYRARLYSRKGTQKGRSAESGNIWLQYRWLTFRTSDGTPAVVRSGDSLVIRGPEGTFRSRVPRITALVDEGTDTVAVDTRPLQNLLIDIFHRGPGGVQSHEGFFVRTDERGEATVTAVEDIVAGDVVVVNLQDASGNEHVRFMPVAGDPGGGSGR